MCDGDGDGDDRDYLLIYPHTEATKLHLKRITELRKKIEKLKTNAKLSKLILGSLRQIRKRLPVRNVLVFCQEIFEEGVTLTGIIEDQEKIGWNNFVLGRWSPLWQQAQHLHYESIGSKNLQKDGLQKSSIT